MTGASTSIVDRRRLRRPERGRPPDASAARACCVLEARARLGGRATAFRRSRDRRARRQRPARAARLLHRDVRVSAARSAPLDHVRLQPQLAVTMIDRAGRRTRLDVSGAAAAAPPARRRARLGRAVVARPPVGAPHGARRCSSRAGHCSRARRAIAASPGETVENWLIRNGQTPRLREMLWDPLALAALNQPPTQAAAPRVRARAGGDVRRRSARGGHRAADPAAAPDVRRAGARVHRAPRRHGADGRDRTGPAARRRRRRPCRPATSGGRRAASSSAVPWFALSASCSPASRRRCAPVHRSRARAWPRRRSSRSTSGSIARCSTSRSSGLPGRAMQWVFDKRAVFGDARVAPVAGVERRRAARRR